jgi:hypothetical protein
MITQGQAAPLPGATLVTSDQARRFFAMLASLGRRFAARAKASGERR